MNADRNLLFGILALQNDFVSRDELVAAMNDWVLEKQTPLAEILIRRGALLQDAFNLLDALVQRQVAKHGDAHKSLAAFAHQTDAVASIARQPLLATGDADLEASVSLLAGLGSATADFQCRTTPNGDETLDSRDDTPSPASAKSAATADSVQTAAPLEVDSCIEESSIVRKRIDGKTVVLFGDYELHEQLGRGGMGVVYRATQRSLKRVVALKMIRSAELSSKAEIDRFHAEAEAAARLDHPNIVPVYEIGEHKGQHYFSMGCVKGQSLGAVVKNGPLPPNEAAHLVEQCARAIQHAHDRGIVHRDLKPGNILLDEVGGSGLKKGGKPAPAVQATGTSNSSLPTSHFAIPKIADFGLAKRLDSGEGMTHTGDILGTPGYMAPEQAAGKKSVGPPVDIYSLGAVLYHLVTGRPPFQASSPMETLVQVLETEPVSVRSLNPAIKRDLETICHKCLQKDPNRRYASAAELADDLARWLAGEPIQARPTTRTERAWRWCKRHPTLASIATFVLLASLAAAVVSYEISGRVQAQAICDLLRVAQTAEVPAIVERMTPLRNWLDARLHKAEAEAAEKKDARGLLHARLALVPVDSSKANPLADYLLDADPSEVSVLSSALAPHAGAVRGRLQTALKRPTKTLRAAYALAAIEPDDLTLNETAPLIVDRLVAENPIHLGIWLQGLRPVRAKLLPALAAVFRDEKRPETERTLATSILSDYAADNPQVLADLAMDAGDKQFAAIFPKLAEQSKRGLPVLDGEIGKKLPADLPSSDERREKLAKRQANAAVALLRINQPATVWPILKHSSDPRTRSYLIHKFSPLGADAKVIAKQLEGEKDITVRRALLLSLGEFGEKEFTVDERMALLPKLQEIYRKAVDPGLHAASEWLLRTWKQQAWLKQINDEWAKNKAKGDGWWLAGKEAAAPTSHSPQSSPLTFHTSPTTPKWYVNTQGQTFIVVPGPVTFPMGSPPTEDGRRDDEIPHRRRIGRTFALAATPVTKEQFLRFQPKFSHAEFKRYPEPMCPIGGVVWYEAARYCNWLSGTEGIPEEQWCFEIKGNEIKLKANYLSKTGYRLPTEAEMEYATRAGAVTARYFGQTEALLPKYAWYEKNSQERTWPVGSCKPNDLGLFDLHGNVYHWCQEGHVEYKIGEKSEALEDEEDVLMVVSTRFRVLRGGSFVARAPNVRSANRNSLAPTVRNSGFGFRAARTLP